MKVTKEQFVERQIQDLKDNPPEEWEPYDGWEKDARETAGEEYDLITERYGFILVDEKKLREQSDKVGYRIEGTWHVSLQRTDEARRNRIALRAIKDFIDKEILGE